jgi:hypothetical protein
MVLHLRRATVKFIAESCDFSVTIVERILYNEISLVTEKVNTRSGTISDFLKKLVAMDET